MAKYSTADTARAGHRASMLKMARSVTFPPMSQITVTTMAETMEANAPAEQDRFQKKAPTVGRNRPAELMVKVMSRMLMIS